MADEKYGRIPSCKCNCAIWDLNESPMSTKNAVKQRCNRQKREICEEEKEIKVRTTGRRRESMFPVVNQDVKLQMLRD